MTKPPLIFVAYLAVLLYFCVFNFNWLILLIFVGSLVLAIWHKYYLVLPILLILIGFYSFVKNTNQQNLLVQPATIQKISPIPDSIQVNGNLLSFQGKSEGRRYQVYYTLKSEQEQKLYKQLAQNCTIDFQGSIEKPETQRNFNGFDSQKYLATQNIYQQIKIQNITKITISQHFDLHLLRRKALVWTQTHFPAPASNYMTGLLFGYLSKDFSEMGDIYSSLGIIHLFALSGMQVNFFINGLRKFLLRLGLRRESVDLLQIPFSIFYAFLTGLSISVIRALVQKNIRLRGLDNVAATTLILLFINPQFLLTIGGQLTLFYAFILAMLTGKFPHFTGFKRILMESSALSLMALPLLIFDFYLFQPLSILLTFGFGLLFDSFLLPFLLFTFLVSLGGLKLPINPVFELLERLVHTVDLYFHYPVIFGKPNAVEFVLLLVFSGLMLDFYRKKKLRWPLLFVLALTFLSCKNPVQPSITVIDVGQGDSIFLQDKFNRQNILIDTGGRLNLPSKNWQKAQTQTNAEKTLIPYLQAEGAGKIDKLILTHTDSDHVGDFLKLADKIKIKEIWVSPGELTNSNFVKQLKTAKIPIHIAKVGEQIPIFNSYLEILSNGYTGKGDNNDSIVTYGDFYGKKFLFTGDLERDGEAQLLQDYPKLEVDILKAGHHGSKTSSEPRFVQKIHPEIALISVGKNNRYHHPNQETLTTYEQNHILPLRTDQHGAIKFTEKQGKWQISTTK